MFAYSCTPAWPIFIPVTLIYKLYFQGNLNCLPNVRCAVRVHSNRNRSLSAQDTLFSMPKMQVNERSVLEAKVFIVIRAISQWKIITRKLTWWQISGLGIHAEVPRLLLFQAYILHICMCAVLFQITKKRFWCAWKIAKMQICGGRLRRKYLHVKLHNRAISSLARASMQWM